MSTNITYDAINVFKYSNTRQGSVAMTGDAAYRRRYRELARDVESKLWSLWQSNEIGFDALAPNVVGTSYQIRIGNNIIVNSILEPVETLPAYCTDTEQGKLAAASCNLVHEATHLVNRIECYPEEEAHCRTIQLSYFRELMLGRSYTSRVSGTQLIARYTESTSFYDDYRARLNRWWSGDLIDSIFSMAEYRRGLESSETANFISRSIDWWGGLAKRWPSTKGYYLRALAAQHEDYAELLLRILESMTRDQWLAARTCAGNVESIRDHLMRHPQIFNYAFPGRIQQVQTTLAENFGVHASRVP